MNEATILPLHVDDHRGARGFARQTGDVANVDARGAQCVDREPPERVVADAPDHSGRPSQANQIDSHIRRAPADAQVRARRQDQLTGVRKVRYRLADVIGDHDP